MIPIYKHEIEAGIAETVKASGSITTACAIRTAEAPKAIIEEIQSKASGSANPDQFDLFYLESILVSTGWNKNDDVFDRFETWAARNTPVDKQFNYMHNEKDIIGHITSSKLVDTQGNVLSDELPFDDVPSEFDIVVGSVLYKYWSDEALQSRMSEIVQGIANNEWFVSMECLFKNFDYALISPEGEKKVVARNEDSSFLTKHLRIYGGEGEYEGYKLGRLLRNFGFSGKGLVDNPANPRSHITNFNSRKETTTFAGVLVASANDLSSMEKKSMAQENTVSQAQYDELVAKLAKVEADALKATNDKLEALQAQVDELTSANEKLQSELDASKEVANVKDENIASLTEKVEVAEASLAEANSQIEAAAKEQVKAARLNTLLGAGVDEVKAAELVEKFAEASDEMFSALVDSLPQAQSEFPPKKDDEKKDDDKKKKEDKGKAEDAQADAASEGLDDAEANDDTNLSVAGENEEETLMAKASAWFGGSVLKNTPKE